MRSIIPDPRFDITDYPVKAPVPGEGDQMVSVMRGRNDFDVPPPSPIGSAEFDEQCELLVRLRDDVNARRWPDWYFEHHGIDPDPPPMFAQFGVNRANPEAAAELVDHNMDKKLDLFHAIRAQFPYVVLKSDPMERSPQQWGGIDFIGWGLFEAATLNAIMDALIESFQVKTWFGQQRPEHYFQAGPVLTSYQAPGHNSYVAGHSAIAGGTYQMWNESVDLTDSALHVIKTACQHYCHYRSFGFVHWPEDNTAGFELAIAKTAGNGFI